MQEHRPAAHVGKRKEMAQRTYGILHVARLELAQRVDSNMEPKPRIAGLTGVDTKTMPWLALVI
jgi:hypothetical protein